MKYKIKQLADLAHISVRTLHYYDQIGLLKPSGMGKNGYRYYEKPELLRLQQVLFYRELNFPLDEIKKILDKSDFDIKTALKEQKQMLAEKKARIDQLILTINKTIEHMNKQTIINDKELYDPFEDKDVEQYQPEAKLRWGETDAYKQSMERVKKITKAEMGKLKQGQAALTQKLADSMDKGPSSGEAQTLIAEHYEGIRFFYDCPLKMYRNLGRMYVNDPRFTAHYEKVRPGMAAFMREAIEIFCKMKIKTTL